MKNLAIAIAFAAAMTFSPYVANAIPNPADTVCSELDANPSTDTIWLLIIHQMRDGASPMEAARIVVQTVDKDCPKHWAEMNRFINEYGNVAGKVTLR